VEVATFRTDGVYTDGRHPDEVRFTTPQVDARRRDFTCNGLFFDPLANNGAGQLHDFVDGRRDIAAKTLRAIGNPEERFREDHLRMLRAVRFAARLGFSIEPETRTAIERLAPRIRAISKERVHDELAMILSHPSRAAAALLLQSTGLLKNILPPEFLAPPPPLPFASDSPLPSGPFEFRAVASLPPESDFVMALAALCKDMGWAEDTGAPNGSAALRRPSAEVVELLRRDLLLSNTESADLAWFIDSLAILPAWQSLPKATFKHLLADPRWPRLAPLFRSVSLDPQMCAPFAQRIAELQAEGVAPAPFITGNTLIQLGASPGPAFKAWLEQLYDRQLNNEFATPESALAAARDLIHPP
jgi:tRNA nucleotidyltransferase/poly(A) polymerase